VNTIVPMHHHMASGIDIRDNLFIDEDHQKLSYPLCSDLRFKGNTLVAREVLFFGPTGEHGVNPKESFNTVFQNYFDATGIVQFSGNRIFAANLKHDVLHIYNRIRTEEFAWITKNENKVYPLEDYLENIPDAFRKTGYRSNFDEVYNKMMERKN